MKVFLPICFVILGFNSHVFAQTPAYVPTNGLVGWWPFNGNANDVSSNAINGTVHGATLTSDRYGNQSNAYEFFGSNWIDCGYNSALNVGSGSFTISCWATKVGGNNFQHLITRNEISSYPNSIYSYALRYEFSGLGMYSSGNMSSSNGQIGISSIPNSSNWNHFVGVYNSVTGIISIYVNGNLSVSGPIASNPQSYNNFGGLFFGVEHPTVSLPSGPNYLTGKLDDIGIWNRALTQQEITNLYNANNSPQASLTTTSANLCSGQSTTITATVNNVGTSCTNTGLPPSLNNGNVGYWPFCGNANDASGNGNNGTVNGATLTTDRFGVANSAYSFDGVNDFISTSLLGITGQNSRTVSFWFNSNNNTTGIKTMVGYGEHLSGNPQGSRFDCTIENGKPSIDISSTYASYTVSILQNNWKLYSVAYDNSFGNTVQSIKLYIDGVLQLSPTILNPVLIINTGNLYPIFFGAPYNSPSGNSFNGILDDIGIWNRALTQQEITQLYNTGQSTYLWSNGATTPSITVSPTQTTTYTCSISMNGATTTQTQTITVNALPTVSAGVDQTLFAGTQVTLVGSGANSYTWDNGISNNTPFTANTTTTYTVTGTSNGCSSTDQVLVTVLPAPSISATNNTICSGQSTTITATVNNAGTSCVAPGLSGTLTNGLVGYWPFCGNANDLSGNTNHGTVNGATLTTDRFGVANSAYSFDGVNDYIQCAQSGLSGNQSMTVAFWVKTGNSSGHVFSFGSNGNSGNDFRILINSYGSCGNSVAFDIYNSGTAFTTNFSNVWDFYVVVFNSALGSTVTSASIYKNGVILTNNCFNVSNTATNFVNTFPITFGRYHGTIPSDYLNGQLDDLGFWNRAITQQEITQLYQQGQVTYLWSNGTSTPSITVSPTQTTTYTCTISMNGASITQSQTIIVNPLPTVSAGANQTVCAGTGVTLSGSGATSYVWNNGVTNATAFTPVATQNYSVTGTNANGCVNTAQVQVTVNALPTVSAGANQTVCAGTGVTLSGSGATSYIWNNGVTNATAFTPVATQNYTVTGTNANGCVNTAQVTVTVNALPTVSAGANQTVCAGTGVTLSGSGATSYVWNNGVTNATAFTPVATQNYTVTGTNANGCVNTAQVTVTVNALPTVSAGANQTVCAGTSVTLSGSGATSYVWNNGITNATAFTPVATQNYTVTGTDANGCVNTAQVTVTVNALPTVSAGANQTVCAGTGVTLSGSGATSYVWNNGVTNATAFTPVATQNYTVTGTNANGCVNTAQVTVTVNALPTVSAGANQTVCAGTGVTLSGSGATSYVWNNGVTNATAFTPVATQNYTVTGTNANGCVNTAQVTVTVNALPTVNAGANQTVCAGTGVTLSGSGATSYVWNNGVTNATAFTPVATQNYTVTGTNANGCVNTAQVTVTVNALPTVSAGANQTVCAGTGVTLSGSGATSYVWNNGVTNATAFTPVATQNYTVTGIDSNLCSNSDTMYLTVNESSSSFLNQTACDLYTLNGQNYTQSGTYIQSLTNALGCDSTLNLNLTMNYSPIPPLVSVTNDVNFSTSVQLNASYQWIICSDNTNIPGAISNNYTATSNGLYGVIVINTCGTDTSNCIIIDNIGLNEIYNSAIIIYPNPTFNFIKINGLNKIGTDFEICDGQGRILKTGNISSLNSIIDIGSFEHGIYWVNLKEFGVYELVKE